MPIQIAFKRYKPVLYYVLSISSAVLLLLEVFAFKNMQLLYSTGLALGGIYFVVRSRLYDVTGQAIFEKEGFCLHSLLKKYCIRYDAVQEIRRDSYSTTVSLGFLNASQENLNQYTIVTETQNYVLRVAWSEENAFIKAVKQYNNKKYGINRFGVHFVKNLEHTLRHPKNKALPPVYNYSVRRVIDSLLEKTGLQLVDLTEYTEEAE